ncbi:MAG: DUF938 domain-containing protein [Pseudomonadota bacterium]
MNGLAARRCSPSAERNLSVIRHLAVEWFGEVECLIEVGSGTGQHAAGIIDALPTTRWQPTDRQPDAGLIKAWAADAKSPERVLAARCLDAANRCDWDELPPFEGVLTVNTLHIMSWPECQAFFTHAGSVASAGCLLMVYGPFHVAGTATSDGNASFDAHLRADGLGSGIRHLESVRALASSAGWLERAHYHVPANNQVLVWEREIGE